MGNLLFKLARPALFFLDPERAHGVSIRALKFGFARTMPRRADDPILATKVWNLAFPNPVGLAAGFDKHAEVCDAEPCRKSDREGSTSTRKSATPHSPSVSVLWRRAPSRRDRSPATPANGSIA